MTEYPRPSLSRAARPYGVLAMALCLVAVCLALVSPALAQKGGGPPAALVETAPVLEREVATKIAFPGTAEPHRLVTLASQVEGLVLRGEVEEGDRVEQGQTLVVVDSSRTKFKADEARAQLREAKANLAQMERDFTRKETLHRTKSVPLKDLEDAETAVERQRALVARGNAILALLEADLADAKIIAPRPGVVIRRQAYSGEWVKKGGPVLVLSVLDPLKVVVQVPERHLPALEVGQEALLKADALPGRDLAGRIAAIIPAGDVRSRSFPVQIRLDNPDLAVMPGMLVRATLAVDRPHKALLVPKEALVIAQTGYSVFVVDGGAARPVKVRLGPAHEGLVEVTGRLKAGEVVVTTGNQRLMPGQPVRVAAQAQDVGADKPSPAQPSEKAE